MRHSAGISSVAYDLAKLGTVTCPNMPVVEPRRFDISRTLLTVHDVGDSCQLSGLRLSWSSYL